MSSATTHGHLPMLSSLMDPTFGIPPDVTFQIMGKTDQEEVECQVKERLLGEVKGHKMLLGLFSPVFKKEFFGPAKETTDTIPVRQTSLESFERMFDYIYNKAIEWRDVSLLEMYDVVNLAEKYQIPGLLDVVKTQMENVHLTMENVIEVADTAAQFHQFPSISSSLLQTCAKFLKMNLRTDRALLQFGISHSGSGHEATALHLLALAKELPGNYTCSHCGEENCEDKLHVTDLSVISRLVAHAPAISDTIMTAILQMFQSSTQTRSGGVQEDALMAMATLVEVLGDGFIKYMDAFKPYLLIGLKNTAEYQVCHAAVGLLGDICRAIGDRVAQWTDEVMEVLLSYLGDNSVHWTVKPQILSVFGDIALAVGPEFRKYLEHVLQALMQASQAQVDYEMLDYLNELREGCLEAYTGIIQGLKGDGNSPSPNLSIVQSHVSYIVQFITVVARDSEHSDASVAASAGLIGDLCAAFGRDIVQLLDVEPISDLLTAGRMSKTTKTKTLSTWATKELRKLKNATSIAP